MAASVRMATVWAWAWVWAWAAGAGLGARLLVSAGGNTSCPWRVALQEERRPGGGAGRLELCTGALPVAFQDLLHTEDSPQALPGTFSKRSSLPPRNSDATFTRDGSGGDDNRAPIDYFRLPGGGLYKIHETRATWLEAKATCEAEGAHLVVIDSMGEAAQLRAHLESRRSWWRQRPFTLHAGFHMDFATPSGRPLASLGYERWAPGQPSASVCGRIDHDAWLLFGACSDEERFVCEYAPAGPAAAAAAASEGGTPVQSQPPRSAPKQHVPRFQTAGTLGSSQEPLVSRAVSFRRVTLSVENFRGNTWEDAKRACAAGGAWLAEVEAASEAELLIDFFQALPGDETQGTTLVGLRTTQAIDVFGRRLSSSNYHRWAKKIFPESCVCIDIKILFHTCSCEDTSLSFLCKMSFT